MKRIMLDTNAYVDFKRGNKTFINILNTSEEIALSSIVVGELLAGFLGGTKFEKNNQELQDFFTSSRVSLIGIDEDTSLFYAKIYQHLKLKGNPIPTNDLWIAACAMQHGYILCTNDKHFDYIDNLITHRLN